MSRTKKIFIAVYTIGVLCVCILLVRMVIGGGRIISPDAMLPVSYAESSAFFLAAGALPMCILSFLLYKQYTGKRRILLFLPAVVTLGCAVYWVAVIAMGFMGLFLAG